MGQSNYIAAAIAIAFLVYITAKGSLANYLAIMTGTGGFSSDSANSATTEKTQSDEKAAAQAEEDKKNDPFFSDPKWLTDFLGRPPTAADVFNPANILDAIEMFGGM